MRKHKPVAPFLVKVLNLACETDAKTVTFENHIAPVWSRIITETGEEHEFYRGDETTSNVLSWLLRKSNDGIVHFGSRFGAKTFRLEYYPDGIFLHSITPLTQTYS